MWATQLITDTGIPLFRCLIRGENVPGEIIGVSAAVGFQATRFVEAHSTGEAEDIAVQALRNDAELTLICKAPNIMGAVMFFESIQKVPSDTNAAAKCRVHLLLDAMEVVALSLKERGFELQCRQSAGDLLAIVWVSRRIVLPLAGSPVLHTERAVLIRTQLDPVGCALIWIGDAFCGKIRIAGVLRPMQLPHILKSPCVFTASQLRSFDLHIWNQDA
jgi:hypothetical protein